MRRRNESDGRLLAQCWVAGEAEESFVVNQEVFESQLRADRFPSLGKQYQVGTSLYFKAGNVHGPHTTKNGCRLLVLWTERTSKEAADLGDFIIATKQAA
jgi:hypothetical protein